MATTDAAGKTARRVPIQSVGGADDETTEALRLVFYLQEVERQSEVFNLAFDDAMDAATRSGPSTETWRHLQSAIFAAIVINRLVSREQDARPWPGCTGADARRRARDVAQWRATELRRLLALPDIDDTTPIFTVRSLRHSLEHVDERLDMALNSGVQSLSDWYVSNGHLLVSPEQAAAGDVRAGLRAFYPEGGLLFFDRETLDLFHLDIDMRKLRHNAREASTELLTTLRGRMAFGGGQVVTVADHLRDRVDAWRREVQAVEADMAPHPPRLDGYVRLWGGFGEET